MKIIDTETVIIGGGASGLAAAIAASRYGPYSKKCRG